MNLIECPQRPLTLRDAEPVNHLGQRLCRCDKCIGRGKIRKITIRHENGFTEDKLVAIGAGFYKPKKAVVTSKSYTRCNCCSGAGVTVSGDSDV